MVLCRAATPLSTGVTQAKEDLKTKGVAGGGPLVVVGQEACRDIRCDFEATCELDSEGYPRCSCLFDCGEETTPVCGSDLRTYPSLCAMRVEACQRQEELRLRPLDLCQGICLLPLRN